MSESSEQHALRFVQRPAPVLAEHRTFYKIAQVLLILKLSSRGSQSDLARLHLFNWAMKDPDRMGKLVQAAREKRLNVLAWGFDPALAYALRYALAEKLLSQHQGTFSLTQTGEQLVDAILADPASLIAERTFLKTVGKAITKAMVDKVSDGWNL
jgi:hypothetical protein